MRQKIADIASLLFYLIKADWIIALRSVFGMFMRFLVAKQEYNCSLLFPVLEPTEALIPIKNALAQSDVKTKLVIFINGPNYSDKNIDQLKYYDANITILRSKRAHGSIGALNVLLAYDYLCNPSRSFSIISDHDDLSDNWYKVMQEELFCDKSIIGVWAETFVGEKNETLSKVKKPKDHKFKSLLHITPNIANRTHSINKKLVESYICESDLSNNFGYAIFGMFRRRNFSQIGLIPETFLGDRFYITKLLSSGKSIRKISKCYRIDNRTNKTSPPHATLQKQLKLVRNSSDTNFLGFKRDCLDLWSYGNHGKFLLANNANIDLELLNAIHNLFIIRKFKNWESSIIENSSKDLRYTISIGHK